MITKKDLEYQKLARKLLKLSSHDHYRMAAVLVRGGRVISVGVNKHGSPPKWVRKIHSKMGLHAEVDCLAGITKDKSRKGTLYVVGETIKGNHILTTPCESCYSMIMAMQLKRIVFETRSGELEEIKLCGKW